MNENSDLIDKIFLCEKLRFFVYKLIWIPIATNSRDPWPISITAKMTIRTLCVDYVLDTQVWTGLMPRTFSTKAMAMHSRKTPSFEVVVEHDAHNTIAYLKKQTTAGVLLTLSLGCSLYIKFKLLDNGLFSVELDLRMF